MTVKITFAELVGNARRAYDEGRLQAQTGVGRGDSTATSGVRCLYSGPCAIGVSIPGPIAQEWDEGDIGVASLMTRGMLVVDMGHDESTRYQRNSLVVDLQLAHDAWAKMGEGNGARTAFERALTAAERSIERYGA